MDKEPSAFRGQKTEANKVIKPVQGEITEKNKLQTMVDVRSDPAYNSDDGYETRHSNPSDDKEIVKYQTDLPYDSDIADSQKHLKEMEKKEGHKLDPIPYLTVQTKDQDGQEAMALPELASAFSGSKPQPQNIVQEKSTSKTAVKSGSKASTRVEAKAKVQTKAEKMSNFVAMRKKMMSNWGTK